MKKWTVPSGAGGRFNHVLRNWTLLFGRRWRAQLWCRVDLGNGRVRDKDAGLGNWMRDWLNGLVDLVIAWWGREGDGFWAWLKPREVVRPWRLADEQSRELRVWVLQGDGDGLGLGLVKKDRKWEGWWWCRGTKDTTSLDWRLVVLAVEVEEESDEGVGDGCKTKPKEKQNKG